MYCQVWWPILEIGALHLTHPSAHHTQQWVVNTHTVNTHLEQWAAIAPAPWEQLGVRCLAQGHLSHGIEGGESAVHSQSPPSIPARPEIRTRNLLDYKSDSLTIRPQLPLRKHINFFLIYNSMCLLYDLTISSKKGLLEMQINFLPRGGALGAVSLLATVHKAAQRSYMLLYQAL